LGTCKKVHATCRLLVVSLVGDLTGGCTGVLNGVLIGGLTGGLTGGFTTGLIGDLISGLTGDFTGVTTGGLTGAMAGFLTGNKSGDLTGDTNGCLISNMTGDLMGFMFGNLTGGLTGGLIGGIGDWTQSKNLTFTFLQPFLFLVQALSEYVHALIVWVPIGGLWFLAPLKFVYGASVSLFTETPSRKNWIHFTMLTLHFAGLLDTIALMFNAHVG
jgi:hypothetical protein